MLMDVPENSWYLLIGLPMMVLYIGPMTTEEGAPGIQKMARTASITFPKNLPDKIVTSMKFGHELSCTCTEHKGFD